MDRITLTQPLTHRLSQRFLKRLSTSGVRQPGRIHVARQHRPPTPEKARKVHQKGAVQRKFAGRHSCDFLPRSSRTFPHLPAKTVRFAIVHIGHSNAASFN